jgi:predicted alpha-1,6-mannanase (GH76 family)
MRIRSSGRRACSTLRLCCGFVAAVVTWGVAVAPARGQVDLARLRAWGLETYSETDRTLRVPGTQLFAETASLSGARSGGFNGRAFVWPAATEFRVFNTLAEIQPATYTTTLRQYSDQLYAAYWNNGYRSGAGGGDRFYDDNGHLVVALTEAFRITHDSVYLDRAKDAQAFVMQGEDSVAGGGIYFKQADFTSKDAISTLQGARGAAMLYRATGQQSYLDDATRLLTWARTHIQRADGMFSERWSISSNGPQGFDLVNSAGIGISTNLELYDATGSAAYLT